MNDGSWWGTGRHVKGFTLPRGGPWAAIDERNPDAMKAFCAWLLPGRPQLVWPDTVLVIQVLPNQYGQSLRQDLTQQQATDYYQLH
jgi:hypothetical protein